MEIYTRNSDDSKYQDNIIEFDDRREMLLSQLRILFSTKPGEVASDPEFGFYEEQYMFKTYIDEYQIKSDLATHFTKYIQPYFNDFKINFDVYSSTTKTGSLVAVLDVYIDDIKEMQLII